MSDLVSGFASGFGRALPQGADFVQNREALRQRREQALIQNQQAQQEMDQRKQQMDMAARQNGFKNMNEAISGQDAAITEYAGAIAEARGRVGAPGSTVTPDLIDRMNQNLQVMINNRNRLGQTANGILGQDVVQPLDQNAVLAQTEGPGFQEQTQTAAATARANAEATANIPDASDWQVVPGGFANRRTQEFVSNEQLTAAQQAQAEAENRGPVPPGFIRQITQNPDGSTSTRLVVEEGGPVDLERQAAEVAAGEAARADRVRGNIQLANIREAIVDLDDKSFIAGLPGRLARAFGVERAVDFAGTLDTIRAQLGFDELQRMRNSNTQGAGLGNVTEREIGFLQAVLGNLDPDQSPEQIRQNLKEIANALTQLSEGWDAPLPYPEVETSIPQSDDLRQLFQLTEQQDRRIVPADIAGLSSQAVEDLILLDVPLSRAVEDALEKRFDEDQAAEQTTEIRVGRGSQPSVQARQTQRGITVPLE